MTIKKSLLAAATVTTVTLAGTGIAAADELPTSTTASSASTKAEDDNGDGDSNGDNGGTTDEGEDTDEGDDEGLLGSIEGSTDTLTIFNNFGEAVAGSISILPNINDAVNDFQDMVDDISGKIPNFPF